MAMRAIHIGKNAADRFCLEKFLCVDEISQIFILHQLMRLKSVDTFSIKRKIIRETLFS